MNMVVFSHPHELARPNTTQRDRLIDRHDLDLPLAHTASTVCAIASVGPKNEDLVALGRYQNFLCVHRRFGFTIGPDLTIGLPRHCFGQGRLNEIRWLSELSVDLGKES